MMHLLTVCCVTPLCGCTGTTLLENEPPVIRQWSSLPIGEMQITLCIVVRLSAYVVESRHFETCSVTKINLELDIS